MILYMIIGRPPRMPSLSKKLNISLQMGSALSRELAEKMLSCQRADFGGFQVASFYGKQIDKPNILPHNVRFLSADDVIKDCVTDVVFITHGPLSQQFDIASQAIAHGKHVIVADARLLHAYGDLLHKMSEAYAVHVGISAALAEQASLGQMQPMFAVQGVERILWSVADDFNAYLAHQEVTERTLDVPFSHDDASLLYEKHQARNDLLSGLFFNKWQRTRDGLNLVVPSVHDHKMAARLNGVLRFVAQVSAGGVQSGLCFLPQDSAVAQRASTTEVVLAGGTKHTMAFSSELSEAGLAAQAMLQDVLRIAQAPKRGHQTMPRPQIQTAKRQSLLFTNTSEWRALKDTLNATSIHESLIGTTLVVTLEHEGFLTIDAGKGSLYALPEQMLQQQVSPLRLAV